MIDTSKVLRPLQDAEAAITRLDDYESSAELGTILQSIWDAVQRTLRQLLRADPNAPDDVRLAALSATDFPTSKLIPALRQRDLISLQLAGQVHELEQAAERAGRGEVRASDADLAQRAVEQLRVEIGSQADRPVREAAHHAVATGALKEEPAQSVPQPAPRKWLRILPLPIVLLIIVGLGIWAVMRDSSSSFDRGVAAFQADRLDVAETEFLKAVEDDGGNTARLYLARTYRRQNKFEEAAEVLRAAVAADASDADARRELGNLFMDLNRPQSAVEQFRRAQELAPDEKLNWIGLVRALRAMGDPEAEQILQQAPPDVRAVMTRPN